MKKIFVGIPVYNEEDLIIKCLDSVYSSLKILKNIEYKVVICFNGTTDESKNRVQENISKFSNLSIIESQKGKTKAIHKIIELNKKYDYGIFVDSDTIMDNKCILNILNKFEKSNPYLFCITGNPIPITNNLISKIINIRRIYPDSQIPPKSFKNFENKRNYIHGRIYALKNNIFEEILKSTFQNSKGDDTYLSYFLIHKFERKSFLELNTANVYYVPVLSLKGWWHKHTRIWSDMSNVEKMEQNFKKFKPYMGCKINWEYVFNQKIKIIMFFILERLLIHLGFILFRFTSKFIKYGWKRLDETKKSDINF